MATRREHTEVELNLTPIMNLFVALIPFLLLSAVFFHLRIIKGSVPAATEGQTDIAKGEDMVTMTVQIDPDEGFHISASSSTLPPAIVNPLAKTIKRKSGQYDFVSLSQYMRTIKRKWDKSDTVIIVADPRVKYKELVKTMDAAREIKIEVDVGGGKKREQRYMMFPRVVVSSLVT